MRGLRRWCGTACQIEHVEVPFKFPGVAKAPFRSLKRALDTHPAKVSAGETFWVFVSGSLARSPGRFGENRVSAGAENMGVPFISLVSERQTPERV